MARTKANRHSLTMPIQESARIALKESDLSSTNEKSSQQQRHQTQSQERKPSVARSDTQWEGLTDHRPNTPGSPKSQPLSSPPYHSTSPVATPPRQDSRDPPKSIFGNLNAAKSGAHIAEIPIRKAHQDSVSSSEERRPSRTKSTPDLRAASVSEPIPDLPQIDPWSPYSQNSQNSRDGHQIPRRPVNQPTAIAIPKPVAAHTFGPGSPMVDHDAKKGGRRFFGMKRSTTSRNDDVPAHSKPGTPVLPKAPEVAYPKPRSRDHSIGRNPSPFVEHDDMTSVSQATLKDQRSQSFRDGPGSVLFQNLSKGAGKAAAGLNKTRKWLGGAAGGHLHHHNSHNTSAKATPSAFANKEPIPNYQAMNLTLPLAKQTRVTRIAKRLEDSKDKTEFWMPALPWRCIDYLNFNGCEAEGLYRVPGSDREIKLWWQRFDQEHDINLFDQEGLYDVNVIGSLFKMWLRNLPEPILSEAIQDELIAKYDDQKQAPEELREVLSKLSPWNYYLLFAITCHLSLLNAYEEKNKMTINNLFICVGPGLRMKQRCFTWLVGDWRSCWTGCTTEKEALEDEYRVLDGDFLPSDDTKERKESLSSTTDGGAVTPPSDVGTKNSSVEPQIHAAVANRRKENRPPRLTPDRSKDDTYLVVNRADHQDNSTTHGRSNSHIPELNLPGKMSPLFAPDTTD